MITNRVSFIYVILNDSGHSMGRQTILRGPFYSMAFIFLPGCTPQVFGSMWAVMYRDSDITTPDRGTLVGTIGIDRLPSWSSYDIDFRSKDQKIRGQVHFRFRSEAPGPLDWDEPDWKGRAFSVALPPGDYEFYAMHVGDRSVRLVVNTKVSLPFQVKRDEAVYVGELKWTQTQREFVGSFSNPHPWPAPVSFSISDRAARDVPIIRERYPAIAGRPLRIAIPVADGSSE